MARLSLSGRYVIADSGQAMPLTPSEGRLLLALMFARELSTSEMVEVIWPDPDYQPETWYNGMNCLLNRIRGKLEPFGWTIKSRRQYGWRLERHAADHREAQEARQAA